MNASSCLEELLAEKALLESVSTGGPPIQEINSEYIHRRNRIRSFLTKVGIVDPNPYSDLWAWHAKWTSGELPTYRSRSEYLRDLFQNAIETLNDTVAGAPSKGEPARTGW